MKKYLVTVLIILHVISAKAQNSGEWYKSNPENGSFGIELQKAYEFLKLKTIKKSPVVAIIGTGSDIEHESFKNSIWFNPNETIDGIDNDKNGYVDDINGWNFLGSGDGSMMEFTMFEGDREWLRLKDKYADIIFDGKNYFKYENGKRSYYSPIIPSQEYQYFSSLYIGNKSKLAGLYSSFINSLIIKEYVEKLDNELKIMFPDKSRKEIFIDDFQEFFKKNQHSSKDSLKELALFNIMMYANLIRPFSENKTPSWENVYDNFQNKQTEFTQNRFIVDLKRLGTDTRKQIVGDNYRDIKDKKYGNNVLLTSNSLNGTMISGIINSIAPDSKIMTLIVLAQSGDPYLKDIAHSVIYAANNGADIILLPQQNSLYPPDQKRWISDAIKYAKKKNILVIVPVSERSDNLSVIEYFPHSEMGGKKKFNNLITVGNSDVNGMPSNSSNYGVNKLDIYAPGINIYSTSPGDLYKTDTSLNFGAAVTAGVAALIRSYFPNIPAERIRRIMIDNPTSREGLMIKKVIMKNGKKINADMFFEELCASKGILNAYNAVKTAASIK